MININTIYLNYLFWPTFFIQRFWYIIKIWVIESFARRYPLCWAILEHSLQQIYEIFVIRIKRHSQVLRLVILECVPLFFREVWNIVLRRRSEHLEDLVQHVDIGVTGEQRVPARHFGEAAAEAPDVNRDVIRPLAVKKLDRAIPDRDNFGAVLAKWNREVASKAKIAYLDVAKRVYE